MGPRAQAQARIKPKGYLERFVSVSKRTQMSVSAVARALVVLRWAREVHIFKLRLGSLASLGLHWSSLGLCRRKRRPKARHGPSATAVVFRSFSPV